MFALLLFLFTTTVVSSNSLVVTNCKGFVLGKALVITSNKILNGNVRFIAPKNKTASCEGVVRAHHNISVPFAESSEEESIEENYRHVFKAIGPNTLGYYVNGELRSNHTTKHALTKIKCIALEADDSVLHYHFEKNGVTYNINEDCGNKENNEAQDEPSGRSGVIMEKDEVPTEPLTKASKNDVHEEASQIVDQNDNFFGEEGQMAGVNLDALYQTEP